jgi:uncharacterized protein
MEEEKTVKIKDATANPAPLGLCAFAMTTILLNLHNIGLYALDTSIMAMGLFYGGLIQIIAGVLEWKKGNTFGMVAFSSYGAFWIALVMLMMLPKSNLGEAPSAISMACFLGMWGVFSLFLFIGTFKLNRALQLVFGTLTLLFFLLAIAKATENESLHTLAGYEGILCGLTALYAGMAQVLNEVFGKTVLPLGVKK